MIRKKEFCNIECDHCHTMLDEESWWDEEILSAMLSDNNWRELGGRHYCPDCWSYDDDDNIVTKDGRRFDGNTLERIRTGISPDELGEKTMQQVTAILAVEKMRRWFDGLTPEEKANFAKEFPEFVAYNNE